MRQLIIAAIASMVYSISYCQDNITVKKLQSEINREVKKGAADTTPWMWVKGGSVALNGTQGSLRNWAAGGDKFSMAINSYVNYYLFYRNGRQNWDNNLDFNFGLLQSTSNGTRKNDDRLDVLSKYGYNFDGKWFLTGLFNFRSQFFDGYNYSSSSKSLSSTFLSPAYVLTSVGFDYKPSTRFSAFISPVTSRWVIVASKKLAAKGLYGVDSGRHAINEFGAFASINVLMPMTNNISYKGRLDLFSNYRNNPSNVDLFFTNYFSFKINKYLAATYNLDFIYDDDLRIFGDKGKSPSLQLKSLIGIGFTMRLK